MNTYEFINSKDISEYLKEIDYQFSAYEMAYLIYQSERTTIAQKLEALETIFEEMPDCLPSCIPSDQATTSTHDLIARYVELTKKRLKSFPKSDGYWFSIERFFDERKSSPYADMVFSTFEGCLSYLRKEIAEDHPLDDNGKSSPSMTLHVAKREISSGDKQISIVLNSDLEPVTIISEYGYDDSDDIEMMLDNGHIQIPVPFSNGDIVMDCTDSEAAPFVFTYLQFWDSKTIKEHGGKLAQKAEARIDKRVAHANEKSSWDSSHMVAMGIQNKDSLISPPYEFMIWKDEFGAANNYLNIEYCKEPLTGSDRILAVASKFEKGELDIESVINLTSFIAFDSIAQEMGNFLEDRYIDAIKCLTTEEVLPDEC